jgi:alkylation response protein AidB-like acyl-CoA dehydrogenase
MDFTVPADIQTLLDELDQFIEDEIKPLERENDNIRSFDHRREQARTDFERDGWPDEEWEALLSEMRRRADAAGLLRYHLPEKFGGRNGSNLGMAMVREHLAAKGLGLHNDLPFEHIYRHHRRYRITEGAEEIQLRRVAQFLFGFSGPRKESLGDSFASRFNSAQHGGPASWLD